MSTDLHSNSEKKLIQHAHLHITDNPMLDFSGYEFENVTFSGNFSSTEFDHVTFKNCTFEQVDFSKSHFSDAHFINSHLEYCNFNGSTFMDSSFNQATIYRNDFLNTLFFKADFQQSIVVQSKLNHLFPEYNQFEGLHIAFTQPYHAQEIEGVHFYNLTPTVGLVSDTEWYSTPYYIIEKYNATPLTIDQMPPPSMNITSLDNEIDQVLNDIDTHGLQANSIAQQILNSQQPLINEIKQFAYSMIEHVDAIWIPGGPDVHPELYGEENTESWGIPGDYYREVLEFSLTEAAIAMDKPILGVCHGSQLINVYLGGTLYQDVEGQYGDVPLEIHTHQGLLGSAFENIPTLGPSYHHQAVKDLAPSLEVVASYNGVVKATQANDDAKIMLCQFHPEYEADQNSKNILNQFISLSSEAKIKEFVLSLKDVVSIDDDTLSKLLNNLGPKTQDSQTNCVHESCSVPMQPIGQDLLPPLEPLYAEV